MFLGVLTAIGPRCIMETSLCHPLVIPMVKMMLPASTKAPLLSKKEKKKMKDHVIAMRDIELEEHRRSTDMGSSVDSNYQSGVVSSSSVHKDSVQMRTRARSMRREVPDESNNFGLIHWLHFDFHQLQYNTSLVAVKLGVPLCIKLKSYVR
ncbi:hypothetical protein Acr_11g0010930 [Actinidia rufa]|uniref:Uncharacterized protein n=1 Tax=Actinidia rufa TaxID=165716 RepID=A0A7J0FFV3_9ERIC|nr:hypothetical protein Acr_11g0010930 [Actinidia rufa]